MKEAREACAAAKKQLGGGIDPSVQKKVIARAWENTFEAIAREWHENKKSAWTERYAEDVLEHIFPYLGNRPINEITPPELLSVLRKIEARGASALLQSSFSLPTVAETSFSKDYGRVVIPLFAFSGQAGSLPTFYEVKHIWLYFCFPQRPEADPSATLEASHSALTSKDSTCNGAANRTR